MEAMLRSGYGDEGEVVENTKQWWPLLHKEKNK